MTWPNKTDKNQRVFGLFLIWCTDLSATLDHASYNYVQEENQIVNFWGRLTHITLNMNRNTESFSHAEQEENKIYQHNDNWNDTTMWAAIGDPFSCTIQQKIRWPQASPCSGVADVSVRMCQKPGTVEVGDMAMYNYTFG